MESDPVTVTFDEGSVIWKVSENELTGPDEPCQLAEPVTNTVPGSGGLPEPPNCCALTKR